MKIHIVAFGNRLEDHEADWIHRYMKRFVKPYAVTLSEKKEPKDPPAFRKLVANELKSGDYLVALDERGKSFSSQEFSKWIVEKRTFSRLLFFIGGSYGLPNEFLGEARESLALSKFTLPHRLALLVLTEQLYRAQSIELGTPYHHAS